MRQATLALNLIVVVFFAAFSAYTFVARRDLDARARAFVTEKTLAYSATIVELAEQALATKVVRAILSADQEAAIRDEVSEYRRNPEAYIADLTRQRPLPAAAPPPGNPLLEKVASLKAKTRTYYDDTLDALITDLRIFSFSNLIAGAIALALAYRSSADIAKPIVWLSFLIFAAVLFCSSMYVDDLTFFRILFRSHTGWTYPLGIGVMVVYLFARCGAPSSAETSR